MSVRAYNVSDGCVTSITVNLFVNVIHTSFTVLKYSHVLTPLMVLSLIVLEALTCFVDSKILCMYNCTFMFIVIVLYKPKVA